MRFRQLLPGREHHTPGGGGVCAPSRRTCRSQFHKRSHLPSSDVAELGVLTMSVGGVPGGTQFVLLTAEVDTLIQSASGCPCRTDFGVWSDSLNDYAFIGSAMNDSLPAAGGAESEGAERHGYRCRRCRFGNVADLPYLRVSRGRYGDGDRVWNPERAHCSAWIDRREHARRRVECERAWRRTDASAIPEVARTVSRRLGLKSRPCLLSR